ncbi:MAG: hypothetical protein DDT34_02531 [Firmicutes bacterium]|nr:hypothetical protein [Bacillota bacterium]
MTPDQFLARYKVRCFYHFTDERNLDSIRNVGGLFRHAELLRRGILVPAPGGNDWSHEADARVGVDEYVHLCMISEHPMEWQARQEGRIVKSKFLQVDPQVIKVEGVRFTSDVSNKSGVQLLTLEEACDTMDFSVIFDKTDWRDSEIQARRKIAKKYEFLVPMDIPKNLITGL